MKRARFVLFLSFAYLTAVFLVVGVGLWVWEWVYRLFSPLPGSPTVHLAGWIALLAALAFGAIAGAVCRFLHRRFYGLWPVLGLAAFFVLGLLVLFGGCASAIWASAVLASALGILSHLWWGSRCAANSPRLGQQR